MITEHKTPAGLMMDWAASILKHQIIRVSNHKGVSNHKLEIKLDYFLTILFNKKSILRWNPSAKTAHLLTTPAAAAWMFPLIYMAHTI